MRSYHCEGVFFPQNKLGPEELKKMERGFFTVEEIWVCGFVKPTEASRFFQA